MFCYFSDTWLRCQYIKRNNPSEVRTFDARDWAASEMWRSVKTLAQICKEYPWQSLCHLPASQSHPWRWSVPIWWICLFPETVLAAVGYLPEIKMQMVTENVFYNYLQKKKFRLVYFYIFYQFEILFSGLCRNSYLSFSIQS